MPGTSACTHAERSASASGVPMKRLVKRPGSRPLWRLERGFGEREYLGEDSKMSRIRHCD
ncbi:hypothetical protein FOMPIDRAFT_1025144 [Fomitopsis schrenkii]|uniref:Uncharacterized protein n=1 Tax=Fomitopsis schrenkii TaxID=2126942 RepID=S8F613_FOMSC|nr:hypothetical protein FOMPIDRAFT_1025144 [Fomitopsis schrenkii]